MDKANKKGVTLIETIVYLALVSLVVSGFVFFALNLQSVAQKSETMAEIESQLRLADREVGKWIREADSINLSQSVLDSHPGELSLAEGNQDVLISINQDDRLQINYRNEVYVLSAPNLRVSNLVFRVFDDNLVEVDLELTAEGGQTVSSRSSQHTYYIRQNP